MTNEITAFLAARYDEDEAAARDWQPHERYPDDPGEMGTRWNLVPTYTPARVLREAEAGRKRLALHSPAISEYGGNGFRKGQPACRMCGVDDGWYGVAWPCSTIRADLAVFGDHPDYRQEWAPT